MKKTLLSILLLAMANFTNAQTTESVLEDFTYTVTSQVEFDAAVANFDYYGGPNWVFTNSAQWINGLGYTTSATNTAGLAGFPVGEKVINSIVYSRFDGKGPTGTTPIDSIGGFIGIPASGNFSAGNTYKVKFDVSPMQSVTYDVLHIHFFEFDGSGAYVGSTNLGSKTFISADYGKQTLEYDITLPTTLTNQFYIVFNHYVTALSPLNQTAGGYLGGIFIDKVTLVETVVTASSEDFENSNFSIYPNPAKDFLNVNSKSAAIQSVVISDINGRTVKNLEFNQTNAQVNVSDLNAGVYILTINSENGSTVKKFIKN